MQRGENSLTSKLSVSTKQSRRPVYVCKSRVPRSWGCIFKSPPRMTRSAPQEVWLQVSISLSPWDVSGDTTSDLSDNDQNAFLGSLLIFTHRTNCCSSQACTTLCGKYVSCSRQYSAWSCGGRMTRGQCLLLILTGLFKFKDGQPWR